MISMILYNKYHEFYSERELPMYNTILFDLDGTLTDSALGIIRCLQYSLEKMGIIENDTEKLRRCIGPSLMETYQKLYGMDEKAGWQAIEFYRERFDHVGILENSLYPGVESMLKHLDEAGKTILLATAKPTVQAKSILERYDLAKYFHTITGSNLDGTRVNKGEVIRYDLLQIPQTQFSDILMVGDREHDILGAKQNQIDSVGVTYGYGTQIELEKAKEDYIVHSVAELEKLLLPA